MEKASTGQAFAEFISIIKSLRTPGTGCPWDLEQDHLSLRPYLIEETYEVLEAIDCQNDHALCDELGDLLLQVVLHAQVANDRGAFDITDVIAHISKKMIRRHPHVFGTVQVESSADVLKNWEEIKLAEANKQPSASTTAPSAQPMADKLSSIPLNIPALLRAQRIGEKAAKVNFDWSSVEGVIGKVKEELAELEEVIAERKQPGLNNRHHPPASKDERARLEHELGDLLFSLCQLARWLGINAEDSLRSCAERFIRRFRTMESSVGKNLSVLSEDELEEAWQSAKARQ
jgi:MazG family protein